MENSSVFASLKRSVRCISEWQLIAQPERYTIEVTCLILSFLVISTGVFVSFNVSNIRRPPPSRVWAVSSSEGIQKSAEVCRVGINDSGLSHLKSRVAFGRTDVIVRCVGVRLWIK